MPWPASWNVVVAIDFTLPMPALTHAEFLIQPFSVSMAFLISGESNLISWEIHLSYTSGPDWRMTISSGQSVARHPVAVPDPMPPHHGFVLPAEAILPLRLIRSSHVVGTVYPAALKAFGEYHTSDLRLELIGAA